MSDGEMPIPPMFIESYHIQGENNAGGGTTYVKLMDKGDSVLLGEFGLVEEASYIMRRDDEWKFECIEKENIDHPPFRRVFEVEKEFLRDELENERFFYGEAIQEAWGNYSEGDGFRLRVEDGEREFEADHQRLMEYDRTE